MKYALEYNPTDPNALTIHFNKELFESSTSHEKSMETETTHEYVAQGGNNTIVGDSEDDNDDTELVFRGIINKDTISPCLKMMGDTIYSLKGVRDLEIWDYEIILVKSLFFEWKQITDSVVATVLMFIEPDGKAVEMPFNPGRKNKKRRTKKQKTRLAEISWSFQENQD